MGMRRIRIANLPPEVPERTLRVAMAPYGEIVSIRGETWSKAYRYTVANGIKMVMMKLNKRLPSHMNIAGRRILACYDSQLLTCYGCEDIGHMYQACPKRQGGGAETSDPPAHVAVKGSLKRRNTEERLKEGTHQRAQTDQISGCPPLVDNLVNTFAPPSTCVEQNDPTTPRRHVLKPQEEDTLSQPTVQPILIPPTW